LGLSNNSLEVDGLVLGSGETINKVIFGGVGDECVDEHLDHQMVRDELTLVHDLLHEGAFAGALQPKQY